MKKIGIYFSVIIFLFNIANNNSFAQEIHENYQGTYRVKITDIIKE